MLWEQSFINSDVGEAVRQIKLEITDANFELIDKGLKMQFLIQ